MNSNQQKVNFMVPGASKAGTTSLHYYLRQHPDIYLSPVKEPHFFDSDPKYRLGCDWYLREYFPRVTSQRYVGEMTPSYLAKPEVVLPRIKECVDRQIRFVVVLRDPVKRAWSHYRHMKRASKEPLDFGEALKAEGNRIRDNAGWYTYFYEGLYGRHLQLWFDEFGSESFLIVKHEELDRDVSAVLDRVFDFLGVRNAPIDTTRRLNRNSAVRSHKLYRFIKAPPQPLKRLYRMTFKSFLNRAQKEAFMARLLEYNLKPVGSNEHHMDPELARSLRERYSEDLELLENLTKMDFGSWKN